MRHAQAINIASRAPPLVGGGGAAWTLCLGDEPIWRQERTMLDQVRERRVLDSRDRLGLAQLCSSLVALRWRRSAT
eukprot:SAG25_NODE_267_length_10655_cov_39.105153_11_plen_76_part_00